MRRVRVMLAAVALAVGVAGCAATDGAEVDAATTPGSRAVEVAARDLPPVTVHKTATCACCTGYEEYLTAHGVTIDVVVHDDVRPVKDGFGVPVDQRSCHTNEIGGYFVEGHVPLEAIVALLDQAPPADGIALAGMPAGSPGMGGVQTEPFVITTILDGEVVGELGRF